MQDVFTVNQHLKHLQGIVDSKVGEGIRGYNIDPVPREVKCVLYICPVRYHQVREIPTIR